MFNKILTALVLAGSAASIPVASNAPVEPEHDPFYALPSGLDGAAPGAILRHRIPPSPIAAIGVDPVNLQGSYQILYKTKDAFDNSTATVATVLVPHNADYRKVLSYQIAQDSNDINCAPSYSLQLLSNSGGPFGTILNQVEILLIEGALQKGWVVVVPDYEGPRGSYLANVLQGRATLDGVRAALQSGSFTGIKQDAAVALWGYSGGSVASGWAAELQSTYAPELKIAGVALGGTVPNITSAIPHINKSPLSGVALSGIIGLASQYPELAALVDSETLPQYRDDFQKAAHQCEVANAAEFLFRDILAMFKDPNVVYTNPVAVKVLRENAMGKQAPSMPLFIYKSINDEFSLVGDSDALVDFYCQNGASVQYQRDLFSEHGSLAVVGAAKALSWLNDVLDGKAPSKGCSTKNVISSLLDPSAAILPGYLINALLSLIGQPVGPLNLAL